jgi:hypothetical protein
MNARGESVASSRARENSAVFARICQKTKSEPPTLNRQRDASGAPFSPDNVKSALS